MKIGPDDMFVEKKSMKFFSQQGKGRKLVEKTTTKNSA